MVGLSKALGSCSLLLDIPFPQSFKTQLKGQFLEKASQSLGWNIPMAVFLPLSEDYTCVTAICMPLGGHFKVEVRSWTGVRQPSLESCQLLAICDNLLNGCHLCED